MLKLENSERKAQKEQNMSCKFPGEKEYELEILWKITIKLAEFRIFFQIWNY